MNKSEGGQGTNHSESVGAFVVQGDSVQREAIVSLKAVLVRIPPEVVGDARRVSVSGAPRLIVDDRTASWNFTVIADADAEYFVEVRLEGKPVARRKSFAFEVRCRCECAYFTELGTCAHVCSALQWLAKDLGSKQPSRKEQFEKFVEACSSNSGNWVIGKLVRLVEHQEEVRSQAETRLQWRVELNADETGRGLLKVLAYEQKLQRRGSHWSSGRQVDWNHPAFLGLCESNPSDYRIANVLRNLAGGGEGRGAVWEILPLLASRSDVVWSGRAQSHVTIKSQRLRIQCVDGEEGTSAAGYRVRLTLGSRVFFPMPKSGNVSVAVLGGESQPCRVLLSDLRRNRLIFSQRLGYGMAEWIRGLLALQVDELSIDVATAKQLLEVSGPLARSVQVEFPASIAGEREPIPVGISLLLEPFEHGLRARLRLNDTRLPGPLVPGSGASEITVMTTIGPRRWVRELESERTAAMGIVEHLGLAILGTPMDREPYAWRIGSIDQAVELLERIEELGEAAPEVLWPQGKRMRMLGEIAPTALRIRIEDRQDWFGIKGVLKLQNEEVALEAILKAIRSGEKYLRVGENAFARISEAFRKRLDAIGDAMQIDRNGAKIARVAAPILQELLDEDFLLETSQKWRETLAKLEAAQQFEPELPEGLKADLREYQKAGYQWLARLSLWEAGGILADDMGLGKTVQTLGVLLDRASEGPALVVAPTSVGDNWVRETERFTPGLRSFLYRDHNREALIERAGAGDIVITSYALLQRDAKRFASRQWHTVVLDEAQFIKNAATKTARATRELNANWRIALSGTPLENHLGELWSLMRTVTPGLLGSWEHFRARFAEPIERHADPERQAALARLVQPFILRRTKAKVLAELPARTEINRFAEMDAKQREHYDAARMAAIDQLTSGPTKGGVDENQQRFVVLSWLTRLRQIACHPRLVDAQWRGNSAKLDLFLETLQQLRDGEHRALVFSQFVQHLSLVREALDERSITYQYLDGATPAAERQRRVDAFQRGEGDVFLISLKAGGTGLNLTAADYVIHMDPWWNPAVEDQATDRAHRIGQDRPVTVLRLIAQGTIEEQILSLHNDKRELVASILEGTDRAGLLSTSELISLIRGDQGDS